MTTIKPELLDELLAGDLSPEFHPGISRVLASFEPDGLGGATGRGAEPHGSSSAPARCTPEALTLA